jgi:hypothetical protein
MFTFLRIGDLVKIAIYTPPLSLAARFKIRS